MRLFCGSKSFGFTAASLRRKLVANSMAFAGIYCRCQDDIAAAAGRKSRFDRCERQHRHPRPEIFNAARSDDLRSPATRLSGSAHAGIRVMG